MQQTANLSVKCRRKYVSHIFFRQAIQLCWRKLLKRPLTHNPQANDVSKAFFLLHFNDRFIACTIFHFFIVNLRSCHVDFLNHKYDKHQTSLADIFLCVAYTLEFYFCGNHSIIPWLTFISQKYNCDNALLYCLGFFLLLIGGWFPRAKQCLQKWFWAIYSLRIIYLGSGPSLCHSTCMQYTMKKRRII